MAASIRKTRKTGRSGRGSAKGLLVLATCGTLALPVVLPYARAIADALLSLIAICSWSAGMSSRIGIG